MEEKIKKFLFDIILENPREAICVFDTEGEILFSNLFFDDIFLGKNFYDIFDETTKNDVLEQLKSFKDFQSLFGIYRIKSKVENKVFLIKITKKDKYFYSSLTDFSKHENFVLELSLFKEIADKNPNILIILNEKGEINFVNQVFINYFKMPREDINGKLIYDFFKNIFEPEFIEELKQQDKEIKRKVQLKIEDREMTFLFTYIPLKLETLQTKNFLIILEDLEMQEKISEELRKMSKFDSLKVITDGISHDLNNVLVSLIGNISLAKCFTKPEDSNYVFLEEAEKACSRAKDLSLKLLTISKGLPMLKKEINFNQLLMETANFVLRGKFSDLKVNLKFEFEEDSITVVADEGQLIQVIDNIVTNACQAMPKGGTLTIGLKHIELVEGKNYLPISEGKYLCAYFKDTGKGISPFIISKIFDPYFTTKPDGNGLGLSISFSIIRNHKGYIDVISQLGVGSTFFVYLPVSSGASNLYPLKESSTSEGT